MTKKQLDALRGCFLFHDADNGALEEMISVASPHIRSYDAGETVYSPSEFERALGIVCKGQLDVYKRHDADGSGTLMRSLARGEVFGAAALFNGGDEPYVTHIKARRTSEVIIIDQLGVETLIMRYPTCAVGYIRFLSGRIRFLNSKIDSFTAGDSAMRLAHYLAAQDSGEITVQGSLTKLANQLDIGRASLYRAIDALEQEGIISYNDKTFVIKDVSRLDVYKS